MLLEDKIYVRCVHSNADAYAQDLHVTMATQSPNPIIVRPQFNLKTSILNNLSDRACFLVQVPENAFLSSGYCAQYRLIILCYLRT